MADPGYGTLVVTKRTSASTTTETDPQVGEHVVSSGLVRLNREWQPKDKATQRFKDDIIKKVEQVLNNTSTGSSGGGSSPGVEPDLFYDTGYFYVAANLEYTKTHNLGQIPTRFTIFYSNVLNPDPATDTIKLLSPKIVLDYKNVRTGFSIAFTGQNTLMLITKDKIDGSGSLAPANGYIRILMWR